MSVDLGTPEEFEEWLATDQTVPLQEWLNNRRIKQVANSIRMVDEYYGEKATREREQVQRSDDLREALAGTTIELIGNPTQFNRKIDVVRYDDAGNREIVGEAELNMDGNVVVMKAEVDKDKLRDLLQTEVDRFSTRSSLNPDFEKYKPVDSPLARLRREELDRDIEE